MKDFDKEIENIVEQLKPLYEQQEALNKKITALQKKRKKLREDKEKAQLQTPMTKEQEIKYFLFEDGFVDVERLQIGDLVSVPFNVACGRCRFVRRLAVRAAVDVLAAVHRAVRYLFPAFIHGVAVLADHIATVRTANSPAVLDISLGRYALSSVFVSPGQSPATNRAEIGAYLVSALPACGHVACSERDNGFVRVVCFNDKRLHLLGRCHDSTSIAFALLGGGGRGWRGACCGQSLY